MKQAILFLKILTVFIITPFIGFSQPKAVIRGDDVNIRDCACLDCPVRFTATTGEMCSVLSREGDEPILGYGIHPWFKIEMKGQEGFVYGAFLDIVDKSVSVSIFNSNTSILHPVIADNVNVRHCAGLECGKNFQLNKSDQVKVIAKTTPYFITGLGSYPWYKIEHKGQSGFVYGAFVDCSKCNFKTGNNSTGGGGKVEGTIIGDQVNIRDCPNTNCKVVFQLNIGEKCIVKNVKQNNTDKYPWYEIEYNGKSGFIFGQYFSLSSSLAKPLKVWALVAGVSDYSPAMNSNGVNNLAYSDEDAKRIYQFLKSPEGGSIPDNQIILLRNAEATRQRILKDASHLFAQASAADLIIVYFSGHGGPNFFMAHDGALKYAEIKTIIEQSAAQKRLCVADACYSGTWSKSATAQAAQKKMTNEQLERLYYDALSNSGNSIALLMSSGRNETSLEVPTLGQGLFTYYYIEGLKGGADIDGNRIITIQELFEYVKEKVSSEAMQNYNHNQTPKLTGLFDQEMPVGVVR